MEVLLQRRQIGGECVYSCISSFPNCEYIAMQLQYLPIAMIKILYEDNLRGQGLTSAYSLR